jgi:hypothetical protein
LSAGNRAHSFFTGSGRLFTPKDEYRQVWKDSSKVANEESAHRIARNANYNYIQRVVVVTVKELRTGEARNEA